MIHRLSSRSVKHCLHAERIKDVSEKLPMWHGERLSASREIDLKLLLIGCNVDLSFMTGTSEDGCASIFGTEQYCYCTS